MRDFDQQKHGQKKAVLSEGPVAVSKSLLGVETRTNTWDGLRNTRISEWMMEKVLFTDESKW